MNKKKGRYVWYCMALAGLNIKSFPRFNSIKEVMADIKKRGGCGPMCEEELLIYDLKKDKVVKKFFWEDSNKEEKIEKPKKPKKPFCPNCQRKKDVIPIVYGFPMPSTMEKAEKGKIHLGGCCVTGDDPQWYCSECKKEFKGGAQ